MKGKFLKNKVKAKNILVIAFVFSLLQSYLFFLDEFAVCVYATVASSVNEVVENNQNTINDNETESTNEVSNTSINANEVSDSKVEDDNTTDENTVISEDEENSETEQLEEDEMIESSLEIINAYKSLSGVVVKAKIYSDISNIKEDLANARVKLNAPEIDGYEVTNAYLEKVELNNENLKYTSTVENNNIIIDINKDVEIALDEVPSDTEIIDEVEEVENTEELQETILENTSREYTVVYVFEGSAEVEKINLNIVETLNYENSDSVELTSNSDAEISLNNIIDNSYSVSAQNMSIYKGYLYANAISTLSYETKYTSIDKVEINSIENIDNIVITEQSDVIVTKDNNRIDLSNYSSYNKTSIKVEEFDNIFGEEGYIEVFSSGRALGRIDSSTQVEDDSYVFEYVEEVGNVEFSFNNMINIGSIEILNNKSISGDAGFSRAEVVNFDKIESNVIVQEYSKVMDLLVKLAEVNNKLEINLEDTESKMELTLNSNDLSTELDNDLTINVTLKTNEEKYELFRNPSIEIEFPFSVESVDVKSLNLLYKNGLTIESWSVETKDTGEKIIKIDLSGMQEEYSPGTLIDGTQIIIYATVKVNKLTANGNTNIKLRYTNEIGSNISYQTTGNEYEEIPIQYVSKTGLLKSTTLENFNSQFDTIFNFNDEINVGKLDVASESRTAKMSMTVLNNYEKDIQNVEIVGRLPFNGNSDENGNSLNSNIDTYLVNNIIVSGLVSKVYYSYDENIERNSDEWQENVDDFSKVKSYKIVLESGVMHKAEIINFEYDLQIPANVYFNSSTYGIYTVYYDYDGQTISESSVVGLESEVREISLEECQTQESIEDVIIGTQVTRGGIIVEDGDTVNEKQILKYKVIATNNSTKTLTNVELKGEAINGNLYYLQPFIVEEYGEEITAYKYSDDGAQEYEIITIEKLEPGESIILEYQVVVNEYQNENDEVYGKITFKADDIEEKMVETIKNKIVSAKLDLRIVLASTEDAKNTTTLFSTGRFKFYVDLKNISETTLENLEVVINIPENLEYDIDSDSYGNEDLVRREENIANGKKLIFEIPELNVGEEKELYVITTIKPLEYDKSSGNLTVVSSVDYDNQQYISNDYTKEYTQCQTDVEYNFSSSLDKETVSNNDEITYTFTMKNIGSVATSEFNVYSEIPYGVDILSAEYTLGNTTEEIDKSSRNISLYKTLQPDETLTIIEKVRVNENTLLYNQEYIEQSFKVEAYNFDDILTEVIKYKIENPIFDDANIEVEEVGNDTENSYDNTNEPNNPDSTDTVNSNNNTENTNNSDSINDTDNDGNTTNEQYTSNNVASSSTSTNNESSSTTSTNNESSSSTSINNELSSTVSSNDTSSKDNSSTSTSKTYSISGRVWEDKNKDGIRNENENLLSNMQLTLYTATVGNNIINEKVVSTKTSENGTYSFENLEPASYVVVLEYDTEIYNVTEYKVSTAKENENSEFISAKLNLNGNTGVYAVSDIIDIDNTNINNLDAGIYYKDEFDLSLTKYISSVTIENAKGTEKITPNTTDDLVKAEISSKYIEGSKITVTYTIEISNTGDIDGYVNKIVDYLPEGFDFDENSNPGWSFGENGNLYNTSLINTVISSGKTKKVNLVLTKTLTDKDTKTYINEAEIAEYTNKLNREDIDSVANNRIEYEDDYDKVELLITVKTGYVIYISMIIIIAILVVLTILIKFKKINLNNILKRNYK